MRYILLLLIISFGCSPVFAENRAMKDMCNRLFPEHSGNFTFELAPDSLENDFFTIESINDKIKISGNNKVKSLSEILLPYTCVLVCYR